MSQYAKLKAQIADLQAQADDVRRQEVEAVIADVQRKIAEYGLTAQDLGFAERAKRGRPPKKAPLPPNTGTRSRAPPGVAAASRRIGSSVKIASVFWSSKSPVALALSAGLFRPPQ